MAKLMSKNLEVNFIVNESSHSDGIIFIHGNYSSHESFKHQFDDLNLKKYRLIAFDLPGHGESQRAPDYSIHLFVSVLKSSVSFLGDEYIERKKILELSQDSKFFKI